MVTALGSMVGAAPPGRAARSWTTKRGDIQALKGGFYGRLALPTRGAPFIRCEVEMVREAVDKATKKDLTAEVLLRNQEENDSQTHCLAAGSGALPSSGSLNVPRPEILRRPETGDRSFGSIFAFDGAAPETINGRLAMLGIVWAFFAERATGMTVAEQLFSPAATGRVFFISMVQLFTYASIVPFMNGESTDARQWGPFNAKAERWNGRLAMIGFAALLIDEMMRQSPVFH